MESIHSLMNDIPFNIWLSFYTIINTKLYDHFDKLDSIKNYTEIDGLNEALDQVQLIKEFNNIVIRSESNKSSAILEPRLLTFIKYFNKVKTIDVKF
jgi:hypothetical protein